MPQDTKNRLSVFQVEVMKDTLFFDTKREVIQIISSHFDQLQQALSKQWKLSPWHSLYPGPPAKLFKGENYRGYPYVNLDFPRTFHAKNIFAFRTMFWWGNHISFTLHLQGDALEKSIDALTRNIGLLKNKNYFLCVHDSPWEYHYDPDNYMPLEKVLSSKDNGFLAKNNFVKISRKLELDRYAETVEYGSLTFKEIIGCLE